MEIKHEFEINAEPKQVFKAITTQEGIEGWWSLNCKIDCKPNKESVMTFVKEGRTVEMHFVTQEVVENKKLKWLCNHNGNPVWINTTLNFEITKEENRSKLVFTQSNFDEKFKDHPAYAMTVDGWNFFMNSLKAYCETGKGQPWG